MNGAERSADAGAGGRRAPGCLRIAGGAMVAVLALALVSALWVKRYVYASYHTPVVLSAAEQGALDDKLERMKRREGAVAEPYSEQGARREISLSEKEINALVAAEPGVARKVAIDLADDLVSLDVVAPVEEGVPLLGGKTLRLKAGVTLSYEGGRPVVILRGVSLGGIPLPNAWLGGLKNRDLIEEFGTDGGFWQLLAAGVENVSVREGRLLVKLKE